MYGIVYETTNLINGKKYIGQHKCKTEDDGYLGSGLILKWAIMKYGFRNFVRRTLCICDSQEELDEQEKYYIELYDATHNKNYYNMAPGGSDQSEYERHADKSVIRNRMNEWCLEVAEYEFNRR